MRVCANCDAKQYDTIPALSHNWSDWQVTREPSCGKEGDRVHRCSNCGAEEHEAISALEHNWSDWSVAVPASCEKDGEYVRTCSNCSQKEVKSIPATGHSWSEWSVTHPADCEHDGHKERECLYCHMKQMETLEALGHKWSDWKTVQEPTLTSEGRREKICSVCGEIKSEQIPMLPGYSITVSAGSGGTVTPLGDTVVAEDGSLIVRIKPDRGYSIGSVILDGTVQNVTDTLVLEHITAPHTVAVSFLQDAVQSKPVCIGVTTEMKRSVWLTEESEFSMSDFKITAIMSENGKTSNVDITKDCAPNTTPYAYESSGMVGEVTLQFLYRGKNEAVAKYFAEQNVSAAVNVVMLGDVDMDGCVDAYDASVALCAINLEMIGFDDELTPLQRIAGDVNKDGAVYPSDCTDILVYFTLRFIGFQVTWEELQNP